MTDKKVWVVKRGRSHWRQPFSDDALLVPVAHQIDHVPVWGTH